MGGEGGGGRGTVSRFRVLGSIQDPKPLHFTGQSIVRWKCGCPTSPVTCIGSLSHAGAISSGKAFGLYGSTGVGRLDALDAYVPYIGCCADPILPWSHPEPLLVNATL